MGKMYPSQLFFFSFVAVNVACSRGLKQTTAHSVLIYTPSQREITYHAFKLDSESYNALNTIALPHSSINHKVHKPSERFAFFLSDLPCVEEQSGPKSTSYTRITVSS